ncbi:hypothetical protein HPB50_014219 [Hyalomma asiaticum]|uniref:Uncharacterized protein n=1 Tax=Hyalomma asiaticum TaxID=266040 RepID=A0ACB7TA82_HYAAI|nr:hypothetical protein HPB50_014219 [Hyalomma asiaticum]
MYSEAPLSVSGDETALSSNYQSGFSQGSNYMDETTQREEQPVFTERDLRDVQDITVIVPEFRTNVAPPSSRQPPRTMTKSTTQSSTQLPLTTTTSTTSTEVTTTQRRTTTTSTPKPSTTPATTVPPTTPTTTPKPTQTTTTPPTTTKETTAPTTPTTITEPTQTTKEPQEKWTKLLCVIGSNLKVPKMLPDDGACHYLFYDSVYKNGPTPFNPKKLDAPLSIFLAGRSNYSSTKLGIAFAYRQRKHLQSELSTKGGAVPAVMKHFLDQDICNFGILDTPTHGLVASSVEQMLESLKLLDKVLKSKKTPQKTCVTAIAAHPSGKELTNVYAEKFSKIFLPDIVIILAHIIQGDNTFKDCHVVPPTMLNRPIRLDDNSSYKTDLNIASDTIRKLTVLGVDTAWALSVTLKGRWTVLKAGERPDFLSKCENDPSAESFGSYAEVCNNTNFVDDIDYKSIALGKLFRSISDGRLLAYDNDTTLIYKLCRVRVHQLAFSFGVAAYDVDYDDFEGVCKSNPFGAFTRLFSLSDVLVYFSGVFDVPAQLEDCLKLGARTLRKTH